MFRLLKLGVGMLALAAIAWFGLTVKLGPHTLFQHLRAIGQTKESQELVDGTRQAAGPIVEDVRRQISGKQEAPEGGPDRGRPGPGDKAAASGDRAAGPGGKPASGEASGVPQERLSSSEQRQLRELLRKANP